MTSRAPTDLGNDFFIPSAAWCQEALARFERREGLATVGRVEEIAALQHDVALRLWRFLATVARRAAALGNPALRLASRKRFEADVASAIGERLGLQVPEDRDLLDRLAVEFHTWLAADNQGERATPWGLLRATQEGEHMEVVPLASSGRLSQPPAEIRPPAVGWETRTLRPVADPFAAVSDRTQAQKQLEQNASPWKSR